MKETEENIYIDTNNNDEVINDENEFNEEFIDENENNNCFSFDCRYCSIMR